MKERSVGENKRGQTESQGDQVILTRINTVDVGVGGRRHQETGEG